MATKKIVKVAYDPKNADTQLEKMIGALVNTRESLLYWKHEAMTRTKVTLCNECLWHHDGFCDQLERTTDDDFWCKSAIRMVKED